MLFLLREYVTANLFFFFSGRLYQSSYGIFRNVCFYWGYTHTNFNSFKRWVLQYCLSHFLNYYSNVLEFDITISLVNVIKSPINCGFSCIYWWIPQWNILFLYSDERNCNFFDIWWENWHKKIELTKFFYFQFLNFHMKNS